MMDEMHDDETQWMQHMSEEHDIGEEHFVGFDMTNHGFNYTSQMNRNNSSDDLHFNVVNSNYF